MIPVDDDLREEARRLLSLGPEEQQIELLAQALAIVRDGARSAEALKRLDEEFLREFFRPQSRGGNAHQEQSAAG